MRQPLDLFDQSVGIQPFDGLDDVVVEGAPPLLEEAAIGDLVGESMLEGVFQLGKEARFVEELGALQMRKARPECLLGRLGDGL